MTATLQPESEAHRDTAAAAERNTSPDRVAFDALVRRLSRQSVEKNFDPFVDIDWEAPEMVVDPNDARWEAVVPAGLRATEWYQRQDPAMRSLMGLTIASGLAKNGLQFENVLQRGLLEFCFTLRNDDARYRYAMHEVIEEGHHSQMFQELVNRSGTNPRGLPWDVRVAANRIPLLGRRFPALFFLFVLGGEDPIDYAQREGLRGELALPPILERIARIHITEEARHLSFARNYLKVTVPKLGWAARQVLAFGAPIILGVMAGLMLRPSDSFIRRFEIPDDVVREAFDSSEHKARTAASLSKVRRLCGELGLLHPPARLLWQAFGIWADDQRPANSR